MGGRVGATTAAVEAGEDTGARLGTSPDPVIALLVAEGEGAPYLDGSIPVLVSTM